MVVATSQLPLNLLLILPKLHVICSLWQRPFCLYDLTDQLLKNQLLPYTYFPGVSHLCSLGPKMISRRKAHSPCEVVPVAYIRYAHLARRNTNLLLLYQSLCPTLIARMATHPSNLEAKTKVLFTGSLSASY